MFIHRHFFGGLLAALLSLGTAGFADALTITTTNDANALLNSMLGSGGAITVTSVTYNGSGGASGTYTAGPLGIADGALFTSGDAQLALPPSDSGATTKDNNLPGDPLCNALIPGYTSYDATKITITFDLAPGFDGISFNFIFGSEEYPEYVGTAYNDVFGAYLNGNQVAFDAGGNPITINGPFFSGGAVVVAPATQTEYDGSTQILQTQATATGGSIGNVLTFVVCDAGDRVLDSGVFISGLNGCVGSYCTGTLPCAVIDDDGDGVNACDDCDDTNPYTYPGATEICDGLDNDCDGVADEGDVCCTDTDGDDYCDEDDNCIFVPNPDQSDVDFDGVGDLCDNCPTTANYSQMDIDTDGVGNACDNCALAFNVDQADGDADGVGDVCDNCANAANTDQGDGDNDGFGNACDNCVDVPNVDQYDADADDFGDVCDVCPFDAENDADNDGICGDVDYCPGTILPETVPTEVLRPNRWADMDGDGIFDTNAPKGKGPHLYFTMENTAGCSCAQIIENLGLGEGHTKFGCSISAMQEWTWLMNGE